MTSAESTRNRTSFDRLRKQIDAEPNRRARVEAHKAQHLADPYQGLTAVTTAIPIAESTPHGLSDAPPHQH
jgi:hypothetical protein